MAVNFVYMTAGSKAEKGDTDDHERQVVPLTDGKNSDKEYFERQSRKR